MNILICDDSEEDCLLLKKYVQKLGHTPYIASNAEEAIILFKQPLAIDVILMDWMIPDINGIELCKKLKSLSTHHYTYIIFVTAKTAKEDKFLSLESGADDFISKPCSINDIHGALLVAERIIKYETFICKANTELQTKNTKLEGLNTFKENVLKIVAHDLRNLSVLIRDYSELLWLDIADHLSDDQKEGFDSIKKGSHEMLSIVNDLLDYSVIEKGKFKLKLETTDLTSIIESRINIQKISAAKKKIQLFFNCSKSIEATIDTSKIIQVIDNLIGNAIKFSPSNTNINITLNETKEEIIIKIKDEGPGIDINEQDAIFESFVRGSNLPTANEKSMGLGLAIVKKIIECHDGSITLKSAPGKGTTFSIILKKQG